MLELESVAEYGLAKDSRWETESAGVYKAAVYTELL